MLQITAIFFALQVLVAAKVRPRNNLILYGNGVENSNFLNEKFRSKVIFWLNKFAGDSSKFYFSPPCYLDSDWLFFLERNK